MNKIANTDDWTAPTTAAGCADWLAAGAEPLLSTLRATDPTQPMWAWGADQHVRFWSRRMLHETGIHRADAQLANHTTPTFDADTSTDGVSEFFMNLWKARAWRWNVGKLRGDNSTVRFRTRNRGDEWTVTLNDNAPRFTHRRSRSRNAADVTVTAPPETLYLLVWRRVHPIHHAIRLTGDTALFDFFHANSAI